MNTKTCTKCLKEKRSDEFFKSGKYPSGKDKIRGDCKDCASKNTADWRRKNRKHYNSYMGDYRLKNPDKTRLHEIKKHYGLSKEDYFSILERSGNKCEICYRKQGGVRPLVIDHCHDSKKVRGILCYNCNRLMSLLDNSEMLAKAVAYKNRI